MVSGPLGASRHFLDYIGEQLGIPCLPLDPLGAYLAKGGKVPGIAAPCVVYTQALGLALADNAVTPNLLFTYREKAEGRAARFMEIAVRLRRGLNVVLGEVGTGKSTLCRELRRLLAEDRNLETHLLDDPYFEDPADFLAAVAGLFGLDAEAMV